MPLLTLLACARPVALGRGIEIAVGCELPDGAACAVPKEQRIPCRCNAHRFDLDAGQVGVFHAAELHEDPDVVFSTRYLGDERCGGDGLVVDEPVEVESLLGAPLYEVDAQAALVPLDGAPLIEDGFDRLVFAYAGDTLGLPEGTVVTEQHDVRFREALRVSSFMGVPCCQTAPARTRPAHSRERRQAAHCLSPSRPVHSPRCPPASASSSPTPPRTSPGRSSSTTRSNRSRVSSTPRR